MPNYFKEVRAEMRHVTWPTRNQAIVYTIVVIAVSIATAVYLGLSTMCLTRLCKK